MKNASRIPGDISQWTVQALTRLLATFAIVQGFFIVIGGPARWQGRSFVTALSVPGAPASWGVALAVLGVVALAGTFTGHARLTAYATILTGTWCLFFAVSFAITALKDPNAATTGVFAYGMDCILACTLGVAYLRSTR